MMFTVAIRATMVHSGRELTNRLLTALMRMYIKALPFAAEPSIPALFFSFFVLHCEHHQPTSHYVLIEVDFAYIKTLVSASRRNSLLSVVRDVRVKNFPRPAVGCILCSTYLLYTVSPCAYTVYTSIDYALTALI